MRLAYVCYWGVNDVLTISSALPTLVAFNDMTDIQSIDFYTFERDKSKLPLEYNLPEKVSLIQIVEGKWSLLSKFSAYKKLLKLMLKRHHQFKYDITIGRSIFGGISVYLFGKKTKVNFIVESFEPHADYMVDTGVWKRNSIKVKLLNYYHNRIVESGCKLVTVSNNYRDLLLSDGVESKRVFVIPCTVDLKLFQRNIFDRQEIRKKLGINEKDKVAIYVGKFGGLYYDNEAFTFFKNAIENVDNSILLILSNQKKEFIYALAVNNGFPINKMILLEVKHSDVPKYLSASDVAFATIKQFPSSKYSSAIKIGEYWANGLPIIITKGVGDDSEIVRENSIGMVIDINDNINMNEVISQINSKSTERIEHIAYTHRRKDIIQEVYNVIIQTI